MCAIETCDEFTLRQWQNTNSYDKIEIEVRNCK